MKKHKKFTYFNNFIHFYHLFCIGFFIQVSIDPVGINNKFDIGLRKDVALAYETQKFVELNKIQPNTIILGGVIEFTI